jgi:hypothetical protein
MRPQRRTIVAFLVLLATTGVGPALAAPLFTLSPDGRTFLYRARPGEGPGTVAEMFGIPPQGLARFLRDNGIVDATRVGSAFVYRIPNTAAQALSDRIAAVEAENAKLATATNAATAERERLAREADEARAAREAAEAQSAHAARLESLWPAIQVALLLLVLGIAAAVYVATAAVNRQRRAERYARALALELDEKRRSALADRQESARRILELESRIRTLEAQIGPRLLVGGRN